MRTFIQFKDNIASSYIQTIEETNGVEVFTDNPDEFIGKILNENGTWVVADEIKYAILNEDGNISEIRKTLYSSIVGDNPIMDIDVKSNWKWDGTKFTAPVVEPTE
jgi:hypothetical protein